MPHSPAVGCSLKESLSWNVWRERKAWFTGACVHDNVLFCKPSLNSSQSEKGWEVKNNPCTSNWEYRVCVHMRECTCMHMLLCMCEYVWVWVLVCIVLICDCMVNILPNFNIFIIEIN
jgi:hypothetical protein